jgi:hypothetical protein
MTDDVTIKIVISAQEIANCRRYLDIESLARGKIVAAHLKLLKLLTTERDAHETTD